VAKQMKAVIRAEVDASGVTRGVNKAEAELKRLNATAGRTSAFTGAAAAMQAAQIGAQIIGQAVQAASNRVQSLQQVTTAYNVQAANAATMAQVADFQRNKRIAASLGPDVIRGIQAQTAAKDAEAARMLSDPLLGPGMSSSMQLGAEKEAFLNARADDAIGTAALGATLMPEVLDVLRNMQQLIRDLGKPF
jgi:hypothetical protein